MEGPIDHFIREHEFLSNFFPAPVIMDGEVYPTVEHAFQAAKTLDLTARARIRLSPSPGLAKKKGRTVELRPDWESMKITVMRRLLVQKFTPDTELGNKLLATGERPLIEGNWWGDTFWGICRDEGQNKLGELLMDIRHHLRVWEENR